jgi:hypothetical protein
MSEEEVAENERMWREENDELLAQPGTDASGEMRGAGISGAGISADLDGAEDLALDGEEPEIGAEGSPPETVTGGDGSSPQPSATDQTI